MLDRLATLPSNVTLPQPIAALERLAFNMYWSWHPEVQELFKQISPLLWAERKGAVHVLQNADVSKLANDKAFVKKVNDAAKAFDAYLADDSKSWFPKSGNKALSDAGPVAYFCAEYAIYEGFNQYAGGLGILAGDHCKEASDLGLPFVPVGLFYRRGFFNQLVDWQGRQEHFYDVFEPEACCLQRLCNPGSKKPLALDIPFPGRVVKAAVWLQAVGRIPLILLDTDLPENHLADRPITSQLYCNSRSMRLHQETVLGVGGVRALEALGIKPRAWHLNEGHSAFLLLERLRSSVVAGASVKAASASIAASSIITIHTPVPEGNERFDSKLA